jgi:hypothetical protein
MELDRLLLLGFGGIIGSIYMSKPLVLLKISQDVNTTFRTLQPLVGNHLRITR